MPQETSFSRARDIVTAFQDTNEASLTKSLIRLRNQLTTKHGEVISASDERLLLLKGWQEAVPAARDLFDIWGRSNPKQQALQSAVVSLLSAVLTLLSTHYSFQPLAAPIVKSLLSPQWLQKLNGYLSGSYRDLILFSLKLFSNISAYSGGRERKTLLDGFAWESKVLPKLLNMRRKDGADAKSIIAAPDIRALYVLFLLSFIDESAPSSVKTSFLEQRRELLTGIFKGLNDDPYLLARKILEVCWSGLWSDPKVKRTLKVAIFQESTIQQIAKLYDRRKPEGSDAEDTPADLVHHFLLAICTTPGVGICFKDRGSGKIHNRILGNVLNGLKVNEDVRQQELALRILRACPELVAGYWSASSLTLEPRLSLTWIANISFLGSVVLQPIPVDSFKLPGVEGSYQPSPPTLGAIIENILPSHNIKIHLSRGLQSQVALVQHSSALALIKCLMKYESMLQVFQKVGVALNEGEHGHWFVRETELAREVRRRVPEFQVVLAFAQQKGSEMLQKANLAKTALLLECAQRLVWLYHQLLPNLVSEARFDVGKLLHTTYAANATPSGEVTAGIDTLRHLHVLRLLRTSDQFSLSTKTGSLSNLGILLKFYNVTRTSAIRNAIRVLLEVTLSKTLLFQHDAEEVSLWLDSLPTNSAASLGETHQSLGESTVITFLDDCAQRCINSAYGYIDQLIHLFSPDNSAAESGPPFPTTDYPESYPSPLILTVIEQLGAKLDPGGLSDSDIPAILGFLHRLFLQLASKASSVSTLHLLLNFLKSTLNVEVYLPSRAGAAFAIKNEVQELILDLARLEKGPKPLTDGPHPGSDFLGKFMATPDVSLASGEDRQDLVDSIFQGVAGIRPVKRALTFINHRLLACGQEDSTIGDLLLLLSSVIHGARHTLAEDGFAALRLLVVQFDGVKRYCTRVAQEKGRLGLSEFLDQISPQDDRGQVVAEYASYWFEVMANGGIDGDEAATATLWIRFMSAEQLWSLVDRLSRDESMFSKPTLRMIVQTLSLALPRALVARGAPWQPRHVEQLTRLQSLLPRGSTDLEPIILLAIRSQLPPVYPSGLISSAATLNSPSSVASNKTAWRPRAVHAQLDIRPFLSSEHWTAHTKDIIADLTYIQPTSRAHIRSWIVENAAGCSLDRFTSVFLAFVDSSPPREQAFLVENKEQILLACSRIVEALKEPRHPLNVLSLGTSCICALVRTSPPLRADLITMMLEQCRQLKQGKINSYITSIVDSLRQHDKESIQELADVILKHGWTWAVASFALPSLDTDVYDILEVLAPLTKHGSVIKSHLVESVVSVAIQNHLSNVKVVDFIHQLVKAVPLKPAIINRQLQTIVQHQKLYELCDPTNKDFELRDCIVHLIYTLFHLHPSNTCQPSHIMPLAFLYSGTLSISNRRLLAISSLYESTRKLSAASLFCGSPGKAEGAGVLDVLQALDPSHIFRACVDFPQWRRLSGEDLSIANAGHALHDPVYVILLFSQMLSEQVPTSALQWVRLFRTNVVPLLLRSLSADDEHIRLLALSQITGLFNCLQTADMVEKPHVLHILNLLKDQYRNSPDQDNPDRLPVYTTLHLAHALRGLFYPSHFTYPMTARHLLQRPELDLEDAPMLYATLYSASDEWKRDRAWMVRFLGDGMVGKAEWKVLRRRHTWDLVATSFQGASDRAFRQGTLRLLANITSKTFTITRLVLKSSLLAWIESQLLELHAGEELAWLRIIENVIVLADVPKLDNATGGEWRLALSRCVSIILNQAVLPKDVVLQALQVVLRLSIMDNSNPHLPGLISAGEVHLDAAKITHSGPFIKPLSPLPKPPHIGQDLFQLVAYDEIPCWWFGQCIEALWRAASHLDYTPGNWGTLTYKFLLWRQYVGEKKSPIGEWVRREVVQNLA